MTKPEKKKNRETSLDAGQWLAGLDYAPTKAEHDARVAATGRPYTDDGHGRSHRTLLQEANPGSARPSSSPT